MSTPAAVLWDLDGTIVDTEPLWMAAEQELADRHGVAWTEADALQLVGNDLMDSGRYLRDRLGSSMTAEEVVHHLVARLSDSLRGDVPWRPGAVELIRALADEGVPQALVTMSWADVAAPVAEALPFDAVVTGDVVPAGKPDPAPYLLAAERLGVDPTQCLAVEDSRTGAASADAAGCLVLVIPHLVQVPASPRRVFRPGLEGITVDTVRQIWASA